MVFRRIRIERPEPTDSGKQAFLNLAGADGEIDPYELQNILNQVFLKDFTFDGFSTDMTRSMVALRDYDMSGRLGYDDFKKLWSDLTLCKRTFMALDRDGSGFFSRSEFQRALSNMGLEVPDEILKAIIIRYSTKEGEIHFDDFVACYIKLRTMLKLFEAKDPMDTGEAVFELDEYIQLVMYS